MIKPGIVGMAASLCLLLGIQALPAAPGPGSGPALSLGPGDVRIEQRTDGGYHLFIRARPGLGSVLLTESTKDPGMKESSYSFRALEKNPINGDEKRLLGGKFIAASSRIYSLIDSNPEADPAFGSSYHIFIPWVVAWGYPGTRSGQVFISDGTFINIRTFEKKYADYSGPFADNPYLVHVNQVARAAAAMATGADKGQGAAASGPAPVSPATAAAAAAPATDAPAAPAPRPASPRPGPGRSPGTAQKGIDLSRYMAATVSAFEALATAGKGQTRFARDENDITAQLSVILDGAVGEDTELVICIDTTESMLNDIAALRKKVPAMLRSRLRDFPSLRIGLVLYRDYFEEYLTRRSDFTADIDLFEQELQAIRVTGGRDIPEAVYEALYLGLSEFPWSASRRIIVLIGDAPPHPIPRAAVDEAMVDETAASLGVEVDVIVLPE